MFSLVFVDAAVAIALAADGANFVNSTIRYLFIINARFFLRTVHYQTSISVRWISIH